MKRWRRFIFQAVVFSVAGYLIGTVGLNAAVHRLSAYAHAETERQLKLGPLDECYRRG